MELGRQLKEYRLKEEMSQEELAERIFVSRQTISSWENDRNYPDAQNLMLLSAVFNVTIDELVKGDVDQMKEEIDRNKWSIWTYLMFIPFAIALFIMIPAFRDDVIFLQITVVVMIAVAFYGSYKLEIMMHDHNIYTFRQIIQLKEGKPISKVTKSYKNRLLPIFLFVLMSGTILLLSFLIFTP